MELLSGNRAKFNQIIKTKFFGIRFKVEFSCKTPFPYQILHSTLPFEANGQCFYTLPIYKIKAL